MREGYFVILIGLTICGVLVAIVGAWPRGPRPPSPPAAPGGGLFP